ncbi:uncharacterized protein SCHCODRAFT_01213227 [Schizophyllum commune H4-8]|nr:uncharacterized protein SCHCODRAFT_01213227 [Schizophyllum commune H4-8]KAI5892724.1 hypothetical protein SCHCODRAFT_01213227 [Schizophyllum commune H4-8]
MASILSSSRGACFRSSGSLPAMRSMPGRPISSTNAHYQKAGTERRLPPSLPDSIRPGPAHHAGVEKKSSPVGEASRYSTQATQSASKPASAADAGKAGTVTAGSAVPKRG